jgi:O-antigen/teichoic acid export membrane protein
MSSIRLLLNSKNTLVIADQLLFSGTNFIMTLSLARLLSPQLFGAYSTIILTILLVISLSNAIVVQPYQVASEKFKKSSAYDGFLFNLQLLVIVFFVLCGFAVNFVLRFQDYHVKAIALLAGATILNDFFRKYFLVKKNTSALLKTDSLLSAMQLGGILYLNNAAAPTLDHVLYIQSICYLPALVYSVSQLPAAFRKIRLWDVFLRYHLKEGRWLSLVSFLQWGSGNLFIVSLAMFINVEALGAFRLVQSLFGILNVLFQTFENYVLPNASSLYSSSIERSKQYLRRTSLLSSSLMAILLCILFICSSELMKLAGGDKYEAYEYIVKGMCILYFILFAGYPIRLSIRMLVLNRQFFLGYLLAFLFSVLFINLLLKHWQLYGVIIGLIMNQLIMLAFWNYQLKKKGFYLWR